MTALELEAVTAALVNRACPFLDELNLSGRCTYAKPAVDID